MKRLALIIWRRRVAACDRGMTALWEVQRSSGPLCIAPIDHWPRWAGEAPAEVEQA